MRQGGQGAMGVGGSLSGVSGTRDPPLWCCYPPARRWCAATRARHPRWWSIGRGERRPPSRPSDTPFSRWLVHAGTNASPVGRFFPPAPPPFPSLLPPPHPPLAHSVVRCCTCPIFCFTRPSPAIDSPPGASTLRPAPLPSAARWGSHAVRALLRVFGFGALGTVASERTGPAARWWWRGAVALNPSPGSHHRHHLLPACRARARGRQPRALRPCVAARSGRVPVGDTLYHTLVHASSRRGTPTRPAGGLLGQVPGDRGLMLAGSRP